MQDFLLDCARYNVWANERIAGVLQQLDDAALDRELHSSFPTIRKTAFHIWDAETVWMKRLQGTSLSAWPSASFPANTPAHRYPEASKLFVDYLEAQDENFFSALTSFKTIKGDPFTMPHTEMIMHCMNHSTFHRGQLITMIRETGWKDALPGTDLLLYYREKVAGSQ